MHSDGEQQEPEHNTDEGIECWCNPRSEYIAETDSYVVVHNTLLKREDLDVRHIN
jgi:hypothetical protein